ncbi:hypothetical protein PanWU01x14_316350, partial [Parasponia andersonii]
FTHSIGTRHIRVLLKDERLKDDNITEALIRALSEILILADLFLPKEQSIEFRISVTI